MCASRVCVCVACVRVHTFAYIIVAASASYALKVIAMKHTHKQSDMGFDSSAAPCARPQTHTAKQSDYSID